MYDSLIPWVNFYIDEENDNIKGWYWHGTKVPNDPLFPLRAFSNNVEIPVEIGERSDVANKFSSTFKNCGFTIKNNKSENIILEINVDNNWVKLYNWFRPSIIIRKTVPTFIVIDNFYQNPDDVRNLALSLKFIQHPEYHKGCRTHECFRFNGLKERFEEIIGKKIKKWDEGINGCFQYCTAEDKLVYHNDAQQYAGVVFLTPNAPIQTGTGLFRSKYTKKMKIETNEYGSVYRHGHYDSTDFELVDVVGNIYNRLVLFDSHNIHAAIEYFGNTKENSRLFQLFFFELD